LITDGDLSTGGVTRLGHRQCVGGNHAERFLAQDVTVVREGRDRLIRVQVKRCGDNDEIGMTARTMELFKRAKGADAARLQLLQSSAAVRRWIDGRGEAKLTRLLWRGIEQGGDVVIPVPTDADQSH
jgi:hypothetical protein